MSSKHDEAIWDVESACVHHVHGLGRSHAVESGHARLVTKT